MQLVLAVGQRHFDWPAELVDARSRGLLARHQGVEFFDVRRREAPLLGDKVEQKVDRLGLIGDDAGHDLRRLVCCVVRNQRCVDALLDQQLGDTRVEGVDAFDEAGLDCPFPLEPFVEVVDLIGGQFGLDVVPDSGKRQQLGPVKAEICLGEVGDRRPSVRYLSLCHLSSSSDR